MCQFPTVWIKRGAVHLCFGMFLITHVSATDYADPLPNPHPPSALWMAKPYLDFQEKGWLIKNESGPSEVRYFFVFIDNISFHSIKVALPLGYDPEKVLGKPIRVTAEMIPDNISSENKTYESLRMKAFFHTLNIKTIELINHEK